MDGDDGGGSGSLNLAVGDLGDDLSLSNAGGGSEKVESSVHFGCFIGLDGDCLVFVECVKLVKERLDVVSESDAIATVKASV